MKKTPLYEKHKELNARMIEFGDWLMPLQYSGILKEHKAVREKAGVFDTSHMGEIVIRGKDSLDLVQRLTTNDVSKLKENEVQYSLICHKNGGIVDDLYVYRLEEQKYMLVINACNKEKDLGHVNRIAKRYSAEVEDISEKITMLALQGSEAENILKKICIIREHIPERKNTFNRFDFVTSKVIVARTGYTGEDGFELFFENKLLTRGVWNRAIKEGATPCGLGARDTLRLERGYPLYGHELNDEITPLEAGLERFVCFEKDFLGREALFKQKEKGLKRRLIGFELIDKGIAREHHKIIKTGRWWHFWADYKVTSGTKSPTLGKSIGMGYVPANFVYKGTKLNFAEEGTELVINIRGKLVKAKVVKRPFVKK